MLLVTDYGTDIRIGKVVSLESGLKNLITALYRRLSTAKGSLFYDPEYGLDLRIFLNSEITTDTLDEIRVAIEQQLERDERVEEVRADVTYNLKDLNEDFRLDIKIQVTPVIGQTFTLVLGVNELTVELLEESLNE